MVLTVQLDLRDHKDLLELMVLKDHRGLKEYKVSQEIRQQTTKHLVRIVIREISPLVEGIQ
jgi:hypothetical protein